MRLAQVNIERRIEALNALVVYRLGMRQGFLVPMKGSFGRLLKASDVMGGDASLIVVTRCLPGLLEELAGIVSTPLEFGAVALQNEFDHWIVGIDG